MKTFLFFSIIILIPTFYGIPNENLISWAQSQGVTFGNVDLTNSSFIAFRDLYRKDLIFSIPLNLTLHPLEDYPFKEYFNISTKDTLIGRLIIEKILGNESSFYPWLESLPKPFEMKDLYHFSSSELQDFLNRSYEEFIYLKSRKEKFFKIRKNIPLDVLNEASFNYDIYNWAASIIDSYSCYYELDHYDHSKLGVIRLLSPNLQGTANLILIPLLEKTRIAGLELQKPGVFNEDFDESPHLFRYIAQKGDNLELRAQRLIEKGNFVQILDAKSNREYLQYNGFLLQDENAKDFFLKFQPDFDMGRIRLCWDLNVSQKKSLVFGFQLNPRSLSMNLILYSKISLMEEKDDYEFDKKELLRRFEEEGMKPKLEGYLVYFNVLLNKWKEVRGVKSALLEDISELEQKKNILNEKQKMNLEFNINSKKVFFRNVLMVQRKMLQEIKKDFLSLNNQLS